jgi:hypothetical protein
MLEFFTWMLWLCAVAVVQCSLCRKFPGIRSMCRTVFFLTAAAAIVPALCVLATGLRSGPGLLARLNHGFGLGVYAQTFLRSILQVRWLAWGPSGTFAPAFSPPVGRVAEGDLLALLASITKKLWVSEDGDHV